MRLTDNDIRHLFKFGMGMQRLDEAHHLPIHGRVEPHPDNPDWINLWVADGANTVLPRDVEHDGIGGYLFNDPWGGHRRVFPLPEAEEVSFGAWDMATEVDEERDGAADRELSLHSGGVPSPTASDAVVPPTAMEYLLVHYGLDGYAWGVWRTPIEYHYGDDAQDMFARGVSIVESWDDVTPWPEWIDSIAWNSPDPESRWDMFKSDQPVDLMDLLSQIRGGLTHAEHILTHGDQAQSTDHERD
ncbi:hypothetical protein [Microbacterium sp. CJ88]|uniref:hypothetical protein n=1 Tax=Microbacterium sp. CJ88 TaxID=3445672 RepID=UPI003F660142